MEKHSDAKNINDFIETFAQYYNEKVAPNTYIILNDVNLGRGYGGGRDYFDQLRNKLCSSISRKGPFIIRTGKIPMVSFPKMRTVLIGLHGKNILHSILAQVHR